MCYQRNFINCLNTLFDKKGEKRIAVDKSHYNIRRESAAKRRRIESDFKKLN